MKTLIALLSFITLSTFAQVTAGKPAPDFSLPSASGKTVKLSDFKDKVVVLEWLNHGCPFVRKHYDSGNMQELQAKAATDGVVWLSIISSAEGKQGYVTGADAQKEKDKNKSKALDILLDPTGVVGKLYGAKTTPHMYIINKGVLAYQGAIDNRNSTDTADIDGAHNYVSKALEAIKKNKKIDVASTKAYGCSVKYAE